MESYLTNIVPQDLWYIISTLLPFEYFALLESNKLFSQGDSIVYKTRYREIDETPVENYKEAYLTAKENVSCSYYTEAPETLKDDQPENIQGFQTWMEQCFPQKINYEKFLDAVLHGLLSSEEKGYCFLGRGNNSKTMITYLICETFPKRYVPCAYHSMRFRNTYFTECNIDPHPRSSIIDFEGVWGHGGFTADPNFRQKIPLYRKAFLMALIRRQNQKASI